MTNFLCLLRVFKEASEVGLPSAVEQDHIDLLVIQVRGNPGSSLMAHSHHDEH